ncbi:MAG: ROK family protein [Pyrinomonadaceae bacterium]
MKEIVLAADLGGTNLRMAAIDRDGVILYRTKRETPRGERAEDVLRAIIETSHECQDAMQNQGVVKAMAIAVPATINIEQGTLVNPPNLRALSGFRLTDALKDNLNLPIILENDANAAAVGEAWLGASKGFQSSICFTIGTGVGGGMLLNGKLWRGSTGTAAELGHVCVEPFGVPCGCGGHGCLEQYASATAVTRIARELEHQYPKTMLKGVLRLTASEVYEAGKQGDELALEVFRQQGFYLGIVVTALVNSLNPEIFVIAGGGAAGWDLFMPHVLEEVRSRSFRELPERTKIVRAALGDDAGILGAAKLAFEIETKQGVKSKSEG